MLNFKYIGPERARAIADLYPTVADFLNESDTVIREKTSLSLELIGRIKKELKF